MNGLKTYLQRGYTLIELSIVMLVIGLIVAGAGSAYKIYKIEQANKQTRVARTHITNHLEEYKERWGRYPCPARPTAQRTDNDYGYQVRCADITAPAGQCDDGICVETSIRTVTREDSSTYIPRVLRGAVPFRDLNLSEDEFYDAFGGRFNYAITENLTNASTFNPNEGGIEVLDGELPTSSSVLDTPGSALFFIFSSGADNIGAYNPEGNLIIECNGPMLDVENCNTSTTDSTAVYRTALFNDEATVVGGSTLPPDEEPGPGVSVNPNRHFDDFTAYRGGEARPLWKLSEVSSIDDAHNIRPEKIITIGVDNDGTQQLNVGGDVRASDTIIADRACERGGDADCFLPQDLDKTGMECDDRDNEAAFGTGHRDMRCSPPPYNCASGEFMIGIDANGTPICDVRTVPVTCPSRTVNLCDPPIRQALTLQPRAAVSNVTLGPVGASYRETWQCRSNGTWRKTGDSGVCVCTESSNTVNNGSGSCGAGYNGGTTTTTTTVCPSGQTTSTTNRAACVCAPSTTTNTLACPSPYTGTITRTTTTTCNNNTPSSQVTETRNCVCQPRDPETRTSDCPANFAGNVTETRTWNTQSCAWNQWAETSSNCTCTPNTATRNFECSNGQTGRVYQARSVQCPSGNWSPWTETSNTCQCLDRPDTRTVDCALNQVGSITETRTLECNGTPKTPWTVSSNTCQPRVCTWRKGSPSNGTIGPSVGTNCECGAANRACREDIGDGLYQGYNSCSCQ